MRNSCLIRSDEATKSKSQCNYTNQVLNKTSSQVIRNWENDPDLPKLVSIFAMNQTEVYYLEE